MKTRVKILAMVLVLMTGLVLTSENAGARHFNITFQVFYDELSPYGTWVYRPDFGYVWLPDAGPDFFPYASDGYWVYTYYGWTWVSTYSWGWAPFHYGRWYFDDLWGPMWIPGYEWGPGWVVWRGSGDYCGWAPMGPGITLTFALSPNYFVPAHHWRFLHYHNFGRHDIDRYYIHNHNNITIINNTTIINNIYEDRYGDGRYMAGPQRHEVERRTGRSINPVSVKERTTPGQELSGKELALYKPRVSEYDEAGRKPEPPKAVKYENMSAQHGQKISTPSYSRETVSRQPAPNASGKSEYDSKTPAYGNAHGKEAMSNKPYQAKPSGQASNTKQPAQARPESKNPGYKQPAYSKPAGKDTRSNHPAQAKPSGKSSGQSKAPQVSPSKKMEAGSPSGKPAAQKSTTQGKPSSAAGAKKTGR